MNMFASKDRVVTVYPKAYDMQQTPYKSVDFDPIVKSACQRERTNISTRICKAVLVGDVAVGKTALVNRFCHNVFDRDYKATIGVDFEVERFSILSTQFNLQIWDTAGQERFKCIATSYYRGANVILVAFDLCDINTLSAAKTWYNEAAASADNPIVFLIGMKKDMLSPSAYESTEYDALKVAKEIGAEYWPTSSKTGENVKDFLFRAVAVTFSHMVSREISGENRPASKSIGTKLSAIRPKELYEKQKRKCLLL